MTDDYERDFGDFNNLPWGVQLVPNLFNNVADAGDGNPGVQRAMRNWTKLWLSGGAMDHDIDANSYNISGNEITGNIVSGSQGIHTQLTGDKFKSSQRGDFQQLDVSGSFCMFNQGNGFSGRTANRQEGEIYYDTSGDSLDRWQTGATTPSGGAWIEIGT